jgi:two-component system cell cycle response regulator DivK
MSTSGSPIVLLVQQPNDDLHMYAEFLTHQGFTAIAVSSGAAALTAAPSVDIIVTAIVLDREMSGVELVTRLRADERTKRKPIIVLTASAWRAERERAQAAGCDLFLPKPCLPDDLVRHVELLLAARKPGAKRSVKADVRDRSDHRNRKPRA